MAQISLSGRRANLRSLSFEDAQLTLPNGNLIRGQILDLSKDGCYIETLEPIPVGTKLHICIADETRRCDLDGRVKRSEAGGGLGVFGLALAFENMNAPREVAIDEWLAAIRALGSEDSDRRKLPRS
jgi:PilZ domain